MNRNKTLEEDIKFNIELVKLLIVGLFATATGVISLFRQTNKTSMDMMFLVLGIFLTFIWLVGIIIVIYYIRTKIKNLES